MNEYSDSQGSSPGLVDLAGPLNDMPEPVEGQERGSVFGGPFYSLGVSLGQNGLVIPGVIPDRGLPTIPQLETMLEFDGQARALEQSVVQPLLGTPFFIEASDEDSGEAQFLREALFTPHYKGGMTTPFETVLHQMTGAFARRRAFFEKVYRKDDQGRWVYHKIAWRPAGTCSVKPDKNGSFDGFIQTYTDEKGVPQSPYFDPRYSFVYIHDGALRPLEGRSMFGSAHKNYMDKMKVTQLYFYHCQNLALGNIKGTYTGGDRTGVSRLGKKAATALGGGAIILDRHEELERMESARSSDDFKGALEYLNGQMALSMLAQFLNLGTRGDKGSWALSRDQSDFFLISLESKLKEMASYITEYLMAPLIFYNFGPDAAYPCFGFEPLSETRKRNALEVWREFVGGSAARNVSPAVLAALEQEALPMVGIEPDELAKFEDALPPPGAPGSPETPAPTDDDVGGAAQILGKLLGNNQGGTGGATGGTQPGGGPGPNRSRLAGRANGNYPRPSDERRNGR